MTGFADIQAALMQAWQSVPLTYPVAYEGRDFTPPASAPWAALFVMPASSQPAAIGVDSAVNHVGLLQIDLNYPLNTGTGQPLTDADAVAAVFAPGATFTYNGVRLSISYCERSSILRDDAYETLHLTVRWQGWTFRN